MKYIIVNLFFCISIFSQIPVQVTYETIRTFPESFFQKAPEEMRLSMKVQFAKPIYSQLTSYGTFSIYKSINSKEASIPVQINSDPTKIDLGLFIPADHEWKYKNFSAQKTTKRVVINDKNYYLEEKLNDAKFIFEKGEIYIDKYKRKLAYEVSNKNVADTVKYWYRPDIAIDDSPSNETGFPGLVLKKQSLNSTTYAIKIEFLNKTSQPEEFDKSTPIITLEEYKKLKSTESLPKAVQNRIEGIKQNNV